MPLAVRQRQVMPTGATYNAPITPIGINDSVYNAARGLANETANLGFQLHQKMAAVDMMSEWSDFEGFVNQQKAEADKFRQSNIDSDLPNGKTVYGDDWDKRVQAITDYANKNLRYGDSKQKALAHINEKKSVWDWQLNNDAFASRMDTALRKFDEYQNTVLTANYNTDILAENSARKQQGLPELSDREYRLKLIEQRANELASTGLINQKGIPDMLARADTALRKAESENAVNSAYEYLVGIAMVDDDGKPLETPDYNRALKKVNSPEFQKAMGFDADAISRLTNQIQNQKTASEQVQAAAVDKSLTDIYNRMNKGETPDYNSVQVIPLDANNKQALWEKWNKVYRGEESDTDPQTAANIKERINNLYRGKETAEQIKADIKKEFQAGRITNNGNQNNSYTGLLNDVDNKWNNIQGEIIQSTYNKAKNTNLYVVVSGSTTDEENIKKQQIINGYLCDLDSALKDYIKSNPNASIKDIQTQADILRRTYSDRAMNEINASTEPKTTKLEKAMKAIDIYTKAFAFPYYTNFALAKSVVNKISKPQQVELKKENESVEEYLARTGNK